MSEPSRSARAYSARRANRKPLRKVMSQYYDGGRALMEVLECGHEQRQKSDAIGPTNAYARRCRQCPDREEASHV